MRILAFDTATGATTVALLDTADGSCVELRDDPGPGERPRHTEKLLALVAQVLQRAGRDWPDLGRLAVGVGPGTFTGLRIGVATARALAQARGVALVGISTLQSLALGAAGELGPDGVVLPVIDARRGEAFAAAWPTPAPPDGVWEPLMAPAALTPERLARAARELGPNALAVGDGALAFRPIVEGSGAMVAAVGSPLHRVSAINHCRLASGETPPPGRDGIRPQYLRLPDAELTRRVALRT